MPPIKYSDLGTGKRICEIVFAGTHDAGITSGAANIKTQALNVGEQAAAGVRFFDLRVAANTVTMANGKKGVEIKTFHAANELQFFRTAKRNLLDFGDGSQVKTVKRTKLRGGDWGQGLGEILQQAYDFVNSTRGGSEFLLLKFDKSTNFQIVADLCNEVLDDRMFRNTGTTNINTMTQAQLAGQVVVLFPGKEAAALKNRHNGGIKKWANLSGGSGYNPNFDGLQYFGKGGTGIFAPGKDTGFTKKIDENESKQTKLLSKANQGFVITKGSGLFKKKITVAPVHADTLGMMYWTSTGVNKSIQLRDQAMWTPPNVARMKEMWQGGLGDYMDQHLPFDLGNVPLTQRAKGGMFGTLAHTFMPNIVMMDFADAARCRIVYDLNSATAGQLAQFADL